MSQVTNFVTPGTPLTMAGLKAHLDACYAAAVDSNRGSSAPSNPLEGMLWLDSSGGPTAEVLRRYTVAAGWVPIMTFNITAGTITQLYGILDEDDMASDSALLPPSQQSVKAYFMAKTGANLAIGSDADGDMYYRASSILARLAKGTANYKMFMNAAGTAPEWALGVKAGTFTRNFTAVAGDVAITGVGFKPSAIIFYQCIVGSVVGSWGFATAANSYCIMLIGAGTLSISDTECIWSYQDGANNARALLKTMDSDGFTLTWAKTGGPTGTGQIKYIAFR